MRQGYRVIDMDTHVDPSLKVLLQYVDGAFPHDALQPYIFTRKTASGETQELRVKPMLYERKAGQIDDPDLAPIWEAANEAKLPLVFHGFYIETPYFPGYRDIWGNAAVARCAGAAWSAQRCLAYVLISGMLDRYPNLKVGFIETGHGWLPGWVLRLTRQIEYVKGVVPPDLQCTPIEYVRQGRVACGIDLSEGLAMTKAAIDVLGDEVLLYQSDYPHPDSVFPDTVDAFLEWQDTLGPDVMRKVMSENAAGFFRLASTPWDS